MNKNNDLSENRFQKTYASNINNSLYRVVMQGLTKIALKTGANLGFSRGGADFQKVFQNFDDLFFRSTK